jgi:hypothetical protein
MARDHTHHARGPRAGQPVDQRLQVRATPGGENGDGDGEGGRRRRQLRRQRVSAFGFEPLATLSVKGPTWRFSVLVTAM